MTQQIQHRMSNPASPWVALGLLTLGGFLAYRYYTDQQKKKLEGEVEAPEAEILPPSAWSADPNQGLPPIEVEAGQLYKAVFTLPLGVTGLEQQIEYTPEGAFDVLDVLIQEIQDEAQTPVGSQVTITFIPKVVAETEGNASIIASNDQVFRGLSLSVQG